MNTHQAQLNISNRIARIAIGAGLIGIVMATSGPLGYLALLPLLAVYPLLTGMLGEDPIDGIVTNWFGGYAGHSFRPSTRVALLVVGAGAIGIVMGNPYSVSALGWIGLLSVYPIMAGLFGEDLFRVVFSSQGREVSQQTAMPQSVAGIKHRETTVHHGFDHEHDAGNKAA